MFRFSLILLNMAGRDNTLTMDPTPTTQLAYLIPRFDGEGSLHVFGNQNSSHLVIMCAGFPDDQRAFSPLAKRLATTEGCLVGVACLPGYDGDVTSHPKDGYSFADLVICLREAVKALRSHSTKSVDETQLTAIFHDWGVVPGFKYTNEVLAEKVSCFEVCCRCCCCAFRHTQQTRCREVKGLDSRSTSHI
jgi:hypothetical protein